MLDAKTRKKIESGFKEKTRLAKKRLFREISRCFKVCDACPMNGQAISDAAPEEPNSYQSVCGKCPIYKRMRSAGAELWEKDTNIEFLLSKGKKLTADEVLYLLKQGATKKSIQHALGFSNPKQLNGFLNAIYQSKGWKTDKVM